MDINDLHPPDDYSHRFFIWHEWIQANGLLTAENVFDYFTTSMFYDKQSNNQVLRMQTIHTGLPLTNEAEELKRFTGVEFAVVHAEPPSLFIIHKRERLSPTQVRPLSAYFIMNNRIYQAPDMYTVLSNRLLTTLNSLQTSLDVLRKHRPDYTPRTGYIWPIVDPSLSDEANKKKDPEAMDTSEHGSTKAKQDTLVEAPKRHQNTVLLLNAMRATAYHSKLALSTNLPTQLTDTKPADSPVARTPTVASTPKPSDGVPKTKVSTKEKKKKKHPASPLVANVPKAEP